MSKRELYFADTKKDAGQIADEIEAQTGLLLKARNPDDTVDGWIDSVDVESGAGFCKLCGQEYENGHHCAIVHFNDQAESPNEEHDTTLRKARLSTTTMEKLRGMTGKPKFKSR